jgi:hypothetical protein
MDVEMSLAATPGPPSVSMATTLDVYVVQKCWHSGPMSNDESSAVDYLRLLPNRTCAEEVAMRSAHAYAQAGGPSTATTTLVQTILLPNGGGYGFVTRGRLFWTRTVAAMIVSEQSSSNSQPPGHYTTGSVVAHALLSNGVIGGTGNLHSRRGTEAKDGCVLIGPPALASQWAISKAKQQRAGSASSNGFVTWVPFGPPPPAADSAFWKEWPDLDRWSGNANSSNAHVLLLDDSSNSASRATRHRRSRSLENCLDLLGEDSFQRLYGTNGELLPQKSLQCRQITYTNSSSSGEENDVISDEDRMDSDTLLPSACKRARHFPAFYESTTPSINNNTNLPWSATTPFGFVVPNTFHQT